MFTYRRVAQYHETDQMKIIHHSNYVKWMEEARVAFLEHVGMGYKYVESLGIVSPVVAINVEYKRQVQFADEIEIKVEILRFTGSVLELAYEFYNTTKEEVCTKAYSKHCFLRDGKIVSLKKAIPEICQSFLEQTAANEA